MSAVLSAAQSVVVGVRDTIDLLVGWLPSEYASILGAVMVVLLVLAVKRAILN
ncbi:MAG: hypothetical protein GXY86_03080 [Firmicutes bacterium]|nr:hypothetical protein [Bacillota bacterium]